MKRIVFVCDGNTCRSPMAEQILKTMVRENNIINVKISSAGLNAEIDAKMNKNSRLALKKLNVKYMPFKAKQLTKKMIDKANLVLCMTREQKEILQEYPHVFTVGEFTKLYDIDDPYGCDLEIYEETARKLENICKKIIEFL